MGRITVVGKVFSISVVAPKCLQKLLYAPRGSLVKARNLTTNRPEIQGLAYGLQILKKYDKCRSILMLSVQKCGAKIAVNEQDNLGDFSEAICTKHKDFFPILIFESRSIKVSKIPLISFSDALN